MTVHPATTPPDGLGLFHELDTPMKRVADAAREVRPVRYDGPRQLLGGRRAGSAYAVLLSGGYDPCNNHIRYYNDMTFILTTLKEVYGYVDQDIFVLMSDGTDPAVDRSDGQNSPPDMDGDGTADIDGPCTLAAIDALFADLATFVTAQDQVFVFTTDHGGSVSGWDAYLNLWNYEELQDDHLAALVNALPAAQFVFTMEQCFSGGFEDDLTTLSPRVFSSAAAYTEYSWAMGDLIYDEYVYYWISAVRGEDPYGTPVDADTNGDGQVTMDEAFVYAEAHDTAGETPQYGDNPAGLGASVALYFGDRGTLAGTVTAVGGSPLAATISAYRPSMGVTYTGATNPATGQYSMGLPVDTYDVTASAFGYIPATFTGLPILLDQTTTQNFVLTAAATGVIQGTVRNTAGNELSGVEVEVLETPVGPVYTNGAGFYALTLPGGDELRPPLLPGQLRDDHRRRRAGDPGGDDHPGRHPPRLALDPHLGARPDSPLSGAAMQSALASLGWDSVLTDDLLAYGSDLSGYQAIFVLVGIYSNNYVFGSSSAEETALVAYLQGGGNLYLEGGDIWCYDSYPATLRPYFHYLNEGDGSADLSTVNGVAGSFTGGMNFSYTGENSWIDHLGAGSGAFEIFVNPYDTYGCGVAYDAGTYRTLALSYEFGGLVDGASTKAALMEAYLDFFGLELAPPETVGVALACTPPSGTLPFTSHFSVTLGNLDRRLHPHPRRAAQRYPGRRAVLQQLALGLHQRRPLGELQHAVQRQLPGPGRAGRQQRLPPPRAGRHRLPLQPASVRPPPGTRTARRRRSSASRRNLDPRSGGPPSGGRRASLAPAGADRENRPRREG